MKGFPRPIGLAAAFLAFCGTAHAQTRSPNDRDTTLQTGGPNGKSGAMGPNSNPDGSSMDGTRSRRAAHPKKAHRPAVGDAPADRPGPHGY